MSERYRQARADHEYLWGTYGEAYDMTGGYEDCRDLAILLKNPTKTQAAKLYEDQICYWLQPCVGPDAFVFAAKHGFAKDDTIPTICREDPRVIEIADRYGIDL